MQQMPIQQHQFYIPTIKDTHEKFDIDRFQKNVKNERTIIEENNTIIEQIYFGGLLSHKEIIYYKNSPFRIIKLFYNNGNIQRKSVFFNYGNKGIEKGIWYEYDKEGKLIKETNYDEGYAFTWDDVLNYCVSNNIPITLGYQTTSTYDTSIERMHSKEFKRNVWKITYPDPTGVGTGKGFPLEVKILDGNTGKVLDTQKGGVLEPREN
ncbi:hypothetical protein GCM10007384_20650 [Aquimarina muelleri]|uniref:MORN repeat variant n=2 Tax=Aquimarina muelleri TaxID=279356 RepID=A0A918JVV1_9FLAO|nr:hypothetical protein GCM10007384_20650 [Aquimarina muelleri]